MSVGQRAPRARWSAGCLGICWKRTRMPMGRASRPSCNLGQRVREADVERTAAADPVLRRMSITKADLEKYGFTAGCLVCRVWLTGRSRQRHSEECRRRLEKEMEDEPKLIVMKEHENEFLERVLRKEDEPDGSRKIRKDTRGEEKSKDRADRAERRPRRAQSRARERRRRARRRRRAQALRARTPQLRQAPSCRVQVSPIALPLALRRGRTSGRRACRRASSVAPWWATSSTRRRRCG